VRIMNPTRVKKARTWSTVIFTFLTAHLSLSYIPPDLAAGRCSCPAPNWLA